MVYVIGVCDAHIVVTVCLKVEHVLAKQNVIMNTFSIKKKPEKVEDFHFMRRL